MNSPSSFPNKRDFLHAECSSEDSDDEGFVVRSSPQKRKLETGSGRPQNQRSKVLRPESINKLLTSSGDPKEDILEFYERIIPSLDNVSIDDFFEKQEGPTHSRKVELNAETFSLEPVSVITEDTENDVEPDQPQASLIPAAASTQSNANEENSEEFKIPKLRCRKFIFKPFVRRPDGSVHHDEAANPVEVVIPEQLAASFGLYIWPCAPVLSFYIWLNRTEFIGKNVLELGAGTALPGLLCGKIGARQVWLSDEHSRSLVNCTEGVKKNELEETVKVVNLTWGEYSGNILSFKDNLDFIIGSDLFFDPEVFADLCETISFLLHRNPRAKFYCTVQIRSSDWSIEEYLRRWKLKCSYIYPEEFLRGTGISEDDLTGRHEIYVLQVKKSSD